MMNTIHMMDNIDKKILNILQDNDKISYHKIAKKLNMAASTVHSRVGKMKRNGIIKCFSAIIEPEKVGYNTLAIIGLTVDAGKMSKVAQKVSSYKEVQILSTTTGDHDLIALIIAKDEKSLWRFLNQRIKTIEGIKSRMDVSSFIDVYKFSHAIKFNITE